MRLMLLVGLSAVLGGCVTGKAHRREVGELEGKVAVLEAQVKDRDESIKVYEGIYREIRQVYEKVESRHREGKDK